MRVFISYSRKDAAFADRLELALKARGATPSLDRSEIYAFEDWWKRIETLIAEADAMIFVTSPDSVASDVCGREIAFAMSLNKRLAPIVCRPVAATSVPPELARLNFVFFDQGNFDAACDRLHEALSTDIEWVRSHTSYGELARAWQGSHRGRSLLRSPELEEAERWIAARPQGAPLPTEATQQFIAESRRAAGKRRNLLVGALSAGLVLALGLAGVALWQRDVAQSEREQAQKERSIAERNFGLAKQTLDTTIFAFLTGFRESDGVKTSVLKQVVQLSAKALDRLSNAAPDDNSLLHTRAALVSEYGSLLSMSGDHATAQEAFEESLAISRELVRRDPNNDEWQQGLSVGLLKFGQALASKGGTQAGLAALEESLAISRALANRNPKNAIFRHGVNAVLMEVGNLRQESGDRNGALAALEEDVRIARQLARDDPETNEWQRDVEVALSSLGRLRALMGDSAGSTTAYEEAFKIARDLATLDPGSNALQEDLAAGLGVIGGLRNASGDWNSALAAQEESLAIRRRLVDRDPGYTVWKRRVSDSLIKVADLHAEKSDWASAAALYAEALAIRREVLKLTPDSIGLQSDVLHANERIGNLRKSEGNLALALAAYKENVTIARELVRRLPHIGDFAGDLANNLDKLAEIQAALGDRAAALAADKESLAISRRLAAEIQPPQNLDALRTVAATLCKIGYWHAAGAERDLARAASQECLAIFRLLLLLKPDDVGAQVNVASALFFLSQGSGGSVDRQAALSEALEILKRLDGKKQLPADRQAAIGFIEAELAKLAQP